MKYFTKYFSSIGNIIIVTNENSLLGIYFDNQKYFPKKLYEEAKENNDLLIIKKTKKWLDNYFQGKINDLEVLPIEFEGSNFQKEVWKVLLTIPYGKTKTYKDICESLEKETHKRVAFQAVGQAIGHNHLSIVVPCHRVIGSDGTLKGYAGGIEKKEALLKLEGFKL